MTTKKKSTAELLFCSEGEIWVSGGHYSLEEVNTLPCVKEEQDGSWGGKFSRIIGVKHIWYRKGFISGDLLDEPGCHNGFEQIGVNPGDRPVESYKRTFKATELTFSPPLQEP